MSRLLVLFLLYCVCSSVQDYFDIITNPIDLSSIDRKLSDGSYKDGWAVRICACRDAQTYVQSVYELEFVAGIVCIMVYSF